MQTRILHAVTFTLLLAVYAGFLVYKIPLPAADDMPRQIAIGKEVLQGNFDVLYKNTFSYTEPDYTFYNHHWLSGVVFALLQPMLGWGGMVLFKTLTLLVAFSIVFWTAVRKANFWLVAVAAVPALLMLHERTGLRPEVFSYVFIAVYMWVLVRAQERPERWQLLWLVPLQLLWVNMHIFFSIGIMIAGGFLLDSAVRAGRGFLQDVLVRKLAILLMLLVCTSLINPRGIEGVLYHYPSVAIGISENQSIPEYERFAAPGADVSVYLFRSVVGISLMSVLVLLGYIYYRRKDRDFRLVDHIPPLPYVLGFAATACLSYVIVRALGMFGLMFLLAVPTLLNAPYVFVRNKIAAASPRIFRTASKGLALCMIVALAYTVYLETGGTLAVATQRGIGLSSMAQGGVDFFIQNRLKGPIFNDADIGSYLIYYLYPQERVFADNRFGDAYSPSFWDDQYLPILANEESWRAALANYNFNVIFLYQYDGGEYFRQFLYNRIRDPEWALVYADAFSVIFVRNTLEHKDVIDQYRITPENAYRQLSYLLNSPVEDDLVAAADIFNLLGRIDLAQPTFLRVVTARPENGKIWMIMGEWELSVDGPEHAFTALLLLQKAIDEGQKTAEAYNFLGAAYNRLGMSDAARAALQKALEINPERKDARQLLDSLDAAMRQRLVQ